MEELSSSKKRIYDAALQLFAAKGYTSCSMSDIAQVVGVKKATLYSHFKNKEEIFKLILDIIIRNHEKSVNRLVDAIAAQDSLKKLEQIYFDYITYCKDNLEVDFWTRFYYFPPLDLENEIHKRTHRYESIFQKKIQAIIEEGIEKNEIKDQNPSDIQISYYYLLLGFVMSLNFYKNRDTKPDATSCIKVFLQGIKK